MSDAPLPREFRSCPNDEPIGRVSRVLGIPETFCVELSAHGWDDKSRVMAELARVFSFPDYFGRNWDAVNDCIWDFRDARPASVVVIRDIPADESARENVARAADAISTEYADLPKLLVVLDGWNSTGIEVRRRDKTHVVPVRALKTP